MFLIFHVSPLTSLARIRMWWGKGTREGKKVRDKDEVALDKSG
jgi:hypothetical protein